MLKHANPRVCATCCHATEFHTHHQHHAPMSPSLISMSSSLRPTSYRSVTLSSLTQPNISDCNNAPPHAVSARHSVHCSTPCRNMIPRTPHFRLLQALCTYMSSPFQSISYLRLRVLYNCNHLVQYPSIVRGRLKIKSEQTNPR